MFLARGLLGKKLASLETCRSGDLLGQSGGQVGVAGSLSVWDGHFEGHIGWAQGRSID